MPFFRVPAPPGVRLVTAAAADDPATRPASRPDLADPDVVPWSAHCDLDDGRRLLTDGGLMLDARP